jgi:hypothetical protein
VDRDIFSATKVGEMKPTGIVTGITFDLGLEPVLLNVDPENVPDNHPLDVAGDTLLYEEERGYLPFVLNFWKDTLPNTPLTALRMTEIIKISLPFEKPVEIRKGFNLALTLQNNFSVWFRDVDISTDSPETVLAKVRKNLPEAFSVLTFIN